MKNILLILLLTGYGAWAQTPAKTEADDAASRDAILRRAMRETMATNGQGDTAKTATNPAAANKPLTNSAAAATEVGDADTAKPASPDNAAPSASGAPVTPVVSNAPVQASSSTTGAVAQAPAATPPVVPGRPFPRRIPPGLTATNPPLIGAAAPGAANAASTPAVPTIPTLPGLVTPGLQRPGAPNAAVAGAVPGTVPPGAVVARAPEPEIPAGQIDFPGTDINQVLDIYAKLVGRTILRPTALPAQMITLRTETPLTKTEAIQALDSVLAMNGITMINVGDKFVKAVPVGQAFQEAGKWTSLDKTNLPEAGQYVTQIVQVKYAKPSELQPVLQGFAKIPNSVLAIDSSGILVIRDYSENVKRMLELIEQIDVTVPLDYVSEVIPIKYAMASDIANALGSLGGGTGTSIGHSAASAGGAVNGSRLGTPGAGIGGTTPFGSSPYGSTTGSTPFGTMGSTTPNSARTASFQDRLSNLVKKASASGDFQVLGQTKIIADERTNSLLVFASKQDMEMITNIISKLDVVLAQVLIEAAIMEVTLSDSQTLGISYLQNKPSTPGNYFSGIGAVQNGSFLNAQSFSSLATNGAAALPSGLSYFAHFGGDFDATLTAIAEDHKVNVLSKPRIQTSHAVPASLQIGDTVPYVTGTYYNGYNGTPSSQYQQTFVGINLQVTPLINPDGLVVMDITQDIQQLGTPTTIDGNPVPTTTKRTAQAKVSVKDRDTIILGGFISTTKTKDKSGVPFLKDIPGLGYLFRSTADSNKRVELVVLIRPTVLPNPGDAALVATQERRKLPGVKTAEAEYDLDEARRLKQSDRLEAKRQTEARKKAAREAEKAASDPAGLN